MEEAEPKTFREAVVVAFYQRRERVWSRRAVKQNPSPHRSFRPTPLHRVYEPPVHHYLRSITDTLRMLWRHKRLFFGMLMVALLASVVMVGLMNQDKYQEVSDSLDNIGESGGLGEAARAGAIFVTTLATGGLNQSPTAEQQILNAFLMVLIWLGTIWALRQILLGRKVRLRDTLYNAFGPLVPTVLTVLVAIVQAIPIFIFIIVYSSAVETGFLANPFYALLFWCFAAGLILLSLRFLISTIVALVAVTAPGLYPMQALSNADDLMRGRKVQLVFHLFWGLVALGLIWAAVLIPIIVIDHLLKNLVFFEGWPIVPVFYLLLSLFSVLFLSAYMYLYYRQLLAEFKPAEAGQ